MLNELDQKSLENAKDFLSSTEVDNIEVGTSRGLHQIHQALFRGLYDFAGMVRKQKSPSNGAQPGQCLGTQDHFVSKFD